MGVEPPTEPANGWRLPDDQKAGPGGAAARNGIRVMLLVGIAALWILGFFVLFANVYGDCFDTDQVCAQTWAAAKERASAMIVGTLVLTLVASGAAISLQRLFLATLAILGLAVGAVAMIGDAAPYTIPYVPGGLTIIGPALVILIVAALTGLVVLRASNAGGRGTNAV
jgi:hypothetical protein